MKHMIAILFAFLALANATEYRFRSQDDLVAARKACVEAKHVPEAHIEKYKKFEFPDDETTRCYMQCILEKFELFNPKTGFNKGNLLHQFTHAKPAGISEATLRADIEKCADKNDQKSDSCTWAYRGFKCFLQNNLSLVKESIKKN